MDLRGHSLLTMHNYSAADIMYLVKLATVLKLQKKSGILDEEMRGKNIALIFELPSTRTRCAFQIAGNDLGMGVSNLDFSDMLIGDKESLEDTIRVLNLLYDGIEYRGRSQEKLNLMAKYSSIPIWNGMTDQFHPTQSLAALLTIWEHFNTFEDINLTFLGDAKNCVARSLMLACTKMGINFTVCTNNEFFPDPEFVDECNIYAFQSGCKITCTEDIDVGLAGTNVVYTDAWLKKGDSENNLAHRIEALNPYRVTSEVMSKATDGAIFMHCLPAFHDTNTEFAKRVEKEFGITEMEVTDEVFRSKCNKAFEQAENRIHTIKAVMVATLNNK